MFRLLSAASLLVCVAASQASVIVQPVSVTSTRTTFVGGEVERTIDQSGLFTTYTSGVTNFDTYIASQPWHTNAFFQCEWWSDSGETTDTLIFDLGAEYQVDRVALWNEESAGLDAIRITTATASDFSDGMAGGAFSATDGPEAAYLPDVFSLTGGTRTARYIRLDVTADLTPSNVGLGGTPYLSMGEFAVSAVPEPGTMTALGLGLAAVMRKRKR